MPQLDYEDHEERNPWRPVRYMLYTLWSIQFFLCSFATLSDLPTAFSQELSLNKITIIFSILTVDALYIRQMHFYAMGKLTPWHAIHMQSLQCVMVGLLMLEIFIMSLTEMFGIFIFLYCLLFASTYLILLGVSIGVLGAELRQETRSIQLPDINNKV